MYISLLFSILAFTVFCYFLKRKYLLTKDIKYFLRNNILMSSSHQNHLKNLRIKSMITNFVIVIVFVEIMFNLSVLGMIAQSWGATFQQQNISLFRNLKRAYPFFRNIENIAVLCHVAIPCLLLKVLLLTYFHCPYKYTVMRWSVYIAVRIIVFALILYSFNKIDKYEKEFSSLQEILRSLAFLADFLTYIIYSRRFYLHLKSREKEARLFKDRTTYHNERSVCLHFKIASILVTIALFTLLIPPIIYPIVSVTGLFIQKYNEKTQKIMILMIVVVKNIGYILYSVVFTLNYLYVVSLIVGSYLVQKRGLVHVNKKIKPIITAYHKSPYFAKNFNP